MMLGGAKLRHGIITFGARGPHFQVELARMAIGPAAHPEPVVNHFVENRIAHMLETIVELTEVSGHFN